MEGAGVGTELFRLPNAATCGDGIQDPGEPCDDGNVDNGDSCTIACTLPGCGEGYVNGIEQCDDGNTISGDGCSASCQLEAVGTANCPPALQTCRTAQRSLLILEYGSDDGKDKLIWKWRKGAATTPEELADPTTAASYRLCLYAGTTSALVAAATVPPDTEHWRALGDAGFKYTDPARASDGIRTVLVKGGVQNKAKARIKGRGAGLPELALPIPLPEPITAQLVNTQTGVCLGASYAGAGVIQNADGQFKAK
jgi:cysteine-rich repeat protein